MGVVFPFYSPPSPHLQGGDLIVAEKRGDAPLPLSSVQNSHPTGKGVIL